MLCLRTFYTHTFKFTTYLRNYYKFTVWQEFVFILVYRISFLDSTFPLNGNSCLKLSVFKDLIITYTLYIAAGYIESHCVVFCRVKSH